MMFQLRGYHPLRQRFPTSSPTPQVSHCVSMRQHQSEGPTTPHTQPLPGITRAWFGLIRFLSPILTEYLFLPVLRCFTSRRSPSQPYIFRKEYLDMTPGGFPHSDTLGSQLVCQLPEAYRRLQRPSSAPNAKASTMCSKKLTTTKTCTHNHTQTHAVMHPRNHRHQKKIKTSIFDLDARVHYPVLKQQPPTHNHHPPDNPVNRSCAMAQDNTTHTSTDNLPRTRHHLAHQKTLHTTQRGCSLITQQCACHTRPHPPHFHHHTHHTPPHKRTCNAQAGTT